MCELEGEEGKRCCRIRGKKFARTSRGRKVQLHDQTSRGHVRRCRLPGTSWIPSCQCKCADVTELDPRASLMVRDLCPRKPAFRSRSVLLSSVSEKTKRNKKDRLFVHTYNTSSLRLSATSEFTVHKRTRTACTRISSALVQRTSGPRCASSVSGSDGRRGRIDGEVECLG